MSAEKIADLIKRGFVPGGLDVGDFDAQDDSDGRGPYIRTWRSATACPYPELIREPVLAAPSPEWLAAREAARLEQEANAKEAEDMKRAAEIVQEAVAQVDAVTQAATTAITAANSERDAHKARADKAEADLAALRKTLEAAGVRLQPNVDGKSQRS